MVAISQSSFTHDTYLKPVHLLPDESHNHEDLNILVVDDDSTHQISLHHMLHREMGARVTLTDNLSDARQKLGSDAYDCVLLDINMPDEEAMGLLDDEPCSEVPTIVMTEDDDEPTTRKAIRRGAQDCLVKGDFDRRQLRRAICNAIERARRHQHLEEHVGDLHQQLSASMTHLEHVRLKVEKLRTTDPTTGLPNHRAFNSRLELLVQEAWRGRHFSMAKVHIQPKGHHSHAQFEAPLMAAIGQWLTQQAREVDCVALCTDNEFGILLVDVEETMAYEIVQRFLRGLYRNLYVEGELEIKLGVRSFDCRNMKTGEDLTLATSQALAHTSCLPHTSAAPLHELDWSDTQDELDDLL